MVDAVFGSAQDRLAAMRAGQVSSAELTEAVIDRIADRDGVINAVCAPDFDRARAAARQADADRAHGDDVSLLGVPVTVKESFNVAGLPTTWGHPSFRDFVPEADALQVERLRAAGAVIVGKTNVPLFLGDLQSYNDIYGTTNNPWDVERTPGGSSGGSAAALAAGYGALSIGSDIGGSLRTPAHFCGVYAHKPPTTCWRRAATRRPAYRRCRDRSTWRSSGRWPARRRTCSCSSTSWPVPIR